MKIFNMDLHIGVIGDFMNICRHIPIKIDVTNWSISGHTWVYNKEREKVQEINENTWKEIDLKMINRFQKIYDNFFETFDLFVVTHTPVFALIFEKYNKPIIIINSCRYDQPFCWNKNREMLSYLNESLKRMTYLKIAVIISNNLNDRDYLYSKTGIVSYVIPSLCLYTNVNYFYQTPPKNKFLVYGDKNIFPTSKLLLFKQDFKKASWKELYNVSGIIHAPYEMSTMSIFEQMFAGIPLFFPTKEFYKSCVSKNIMRFDSFTSYGKQHTEEEFIKWINNADFYIYPVFYYYDNFDDLLYQIRNFKDIKKDFRLQYINSLKYKVINSWNNIFKNIIKHYPVSNSNTNNNNIDILHKENFKNMDKSRTVQDKYIKVILIILFAIIFLIFYFLKI